MPNNHVITESKETSASKLCRFLVENAGQKVPGSIAGILSEYKELLAQLGVRRTAASTLEGFAIQADELNVTLSTASAQCESTRSKLMEMAGEFGCACLAAIQKGHSFPDTSKPLADAERKVASIRSELDAVDEGKGMMAGAKAKAQKMVLAGRLKVAEFSRDSAAKSLGTSVLASGQEESFTHECTVDVQKQIRPLRQAVLKEAQTVKTAAEALNEALKSASKLLESEGSLETSEQLRDKLAEERVAVEEMMGRLPVLEHSLANAIVLSDMSEWDIANFENILAEFRASVATEEMNTLHGERSAENNKYTDPKFVEQLPVDGPLKVDHYKYYLEDIYRNAAEKVMFSRDAITSYYRNVTEQMRKPDLTALLKCSAVQLPAVYKEAKWISGLFSVDVPDIYVFHMDMIGMNPEGLANPWIEIYSLTLAELSKAELSFMLGRSIGHIHCNHMLYEVLSEGLLDAAEHLNSVPGVGAILAMVGPNRVNQALKLVLYPWNRASEYTADFGGYLASGGDLKASCSAILKSVLRSGKLAEAASLKEFYRQVDIIDGMTGYIANFSKIDDKWPYAQYRMRELIRYASSERGKRALKLVRKWEAEHVRP